MDVPEEWRETETDRTRRRKQDVHEKLYNFLNRSAQSLAGAPSRRAKDKESTDTDRDAPRVSHAAASRRPVLPGSPESTPGMYSSLRSTYMHKTAGAAGLRKSSSPPLSPRSKHGHRTVPSSSQANNTIAYSYNTPPHTPSSSRIHSSPSSPSPPTVSRIVNGTDTLIKRSIARPITPSNSSSAGRRVLGILLPSPTFRKATPSNDDHHKCSTHKPRSGSGSSHEPLLLTQSRTSDRDRVVARPDPRATSTLASQSARVKTSEDRLQNPFPSPPTTTRSQRVAAHREEAASPTPTSRKSTPKLDFWRSATPRSFSTQGERSKGKQRAVSPDGAKKIAETAPLRAPQPRAPVTFLPEVPRLQRTPPTPKRGEKRESRPSLRVDSFMSDSVPVPQAHLTAPPAGDSSVLSRYPSFAQNPTRQAHTPAPRPAERELAPVSEIQRSRSAPGATRGRISPCLRIPSPKFLSKDKGKNRERSREREKDAHCEKRRVTPESVGKPILREALRVHTGEKSKGAKATQLAHSVTHARRAAQHGTFDFERPGSQNSSKSGQSESHGTRSDEEKENEKGAKAQVGGRDAVVAARTVEPAKVKPRAPSPVPPLPTTRLKPRSPPPARTRSPLANSPAGTARSTSPMVDDSALPRLSSSLGRRGNSKPRAHRPQGSLPAFSFEPAAPSSPPSSSRPSRDASIRNRQYVDTHTGLMWAPTRLKENAIPEGGVHVRSPDVGGGETGPVVISARELEAATAVIMQFKSALDDAGFATLQKYVRRYDEQIIPLEGPAGLLVRVQRLLETSAPRVDERRKRQLLDSFIRVVSQVS